MRMGDCDMVGVIVLACVVVVSGAALLAFRWHLDARERAAALTSRQIDEGLRTLPAHVVELERRIRQLEVKPLGR